MIRIALVGQPNCGKSTIFNHLVGYKAHTSNLPGTTVEYLTSEALVAGAHAEVVDLPGVYSLLSADAAEAETRSYLMTQPIDVVLDVVDASLLSRSLELTLQLIELGLPTVVCLNMEDEARRKGITIDIDRLASLLGVPVVTAIAVRGVGVKQAAAEAVAAARRGQAPSPIPFSADVESVLRRVEAFLESSSVENPRPCRMLAIQLMEGETHVLDAFPAKRPQIQKLVEELIAPLEQSRGRSGEDLLSAERHAKAMELFEHTSAVGAPTLGWRDRIDGFLMHPLFGVLALGAILYTLFFFVFRVGSLVEAPILDGFERVGIWLAAVLPAGGAAYHAVNGLIQGVGGAVGIVLPYLVPFLIGLSLLEDIGYLPRAGYLADGLMHRIGLHGTSVIPFILGYGCSVPAVMATRILSSRRDRFLTAMLSVMVPCVARATVIYGLIGYFLGPELAFLLYIINIVVIAVAGRLLTALFPRVTPGLILEIPSYKIPAPRVVLSKVWLHLRDFLAVALPILVLGSVGMSLLEYLGVERYLNLAALPVTWSLGLPLAVGVPLLFGIFRKELALVMLFQALGTTAIAGVLTAAQMMTYALFLLFYVPCIATIAVLKRELGWRQTSFVVLGTSSIALIVGLLARGIGAWIGS